jgi:hypothetical protein
MGREDDFLGIWEFSGKQTKNKMNKGRTNNEHDEHEEQLERN